MIGGIISYLFPGPFTEKKAISKIYPLIGCILEIDLLVIR